MTLPAEDVLAIQKLAADYSFAMDTGDGEGVAACFEPGGSLDTGVAKVEGHEALVALTAQLRTQMAGGRHVVTNLSIDGDGAEARARMYLQVFVTAGGVEATKLVVSGRYDDVLRRGAGGWRFVERVMTADS